MSSWNLSAGAVEAAMRAAAAAGLAAESAVLLSETHHVVVRLEPAGVIAKVAPWEHGRERLVREHDVAEALRASDLVVPPVCKPVDDPTTGWVATFWHRLEHDPLYEPKADELAHALRALHAALDAVDLSLPSFLDGLARARMAVDDDAHMSALDAASRSTLADAFDAWLSDLEAARWTDRRLHGEPHDRNVLFTPDGPRWIDLESVCRGPLEWDLAFLADEAAARFSEADRDLLALIRLVNSARVATWCWGRVDVGDMRWHAEHHLGVVVRNAPR